MNILLINHYAGSIYHGREYRTYYMAREWIRSGHNVIVAAADHSHVRNAAINIPASKNYLIEKIDGITYIWFRTTEYNCNGVKRAINIASFMVQLYRFGKSIVHKYSPDVVIASSTYPSDIFPAYYIANKSHAKLIYEIHDLWPLSPMELGHMSKFHPFILGMQYAEDFCYKYCDAVVSILPKVHEHVKKHGLPLEKLHIIENGICLEEWHDQIDIPQKLETIINNEKSKGNTVLGYTGGHGISNSINTIIDAAEMLKNEKISIILVGNGIEKNKLIESAQNKSLNNIIFYENINKRSIPKLLSKFDALLITWAKRWNLYKYGVSPNKIMDYMMSGKPIIQAIEAGNDIVKDSGCGISVHAEAPQELAEAIKHICTLKPEQRKAMGLRGQQYVKDNHDYRILGERFLSIMKDLQNK